MCNSLHSDYILRKDSVFFDTMRNLGILFLFYILFIMFYKVCYEVSWLRLCVNVYDTKFTSKQSFVLFKPCFTPI